MTQPLSCSLAVWAKVNLIKCPNQQGRHLKVPNSICFETQMVTFTDINYRFI